MKCFEVHGGVVKRGLVVQPPAEGDERNYVWIRTGMDVQLPTKKALLADPLVAKVNEAMCGGLFRHEILRIMECDVDLRTDLWLTERSPETSKDALVLVSDWVWINPDQHTGDVTVAFEKSEVECYVQDRVSNLPGNSKPWVGCGLAALVRMRPGSTLRIRQLRKLKVGPVKAALKRIGSQAIDSTRELKVDAEGNLTCTD